MKEKTLAGFQIDPELLEGARRLVTINAGVRSGERVVIVSDTARPATIRETVAAVVSEAGATPILIVTDPIPSGAEPPAPVAEAFLAADVILAPTSGAI